MCGYIVGSISLVPAFVAVLPVPGEGAHTTTHGEAPWDMGGLGHALATNDGSVAAGMGRAPRACLVFA